MTSYYKRRRNKKHKSRPTAVGNVLQSKLTSLGLSSAVNLSAIRKAWRNVAGAKVAGNAWPNAYRDQTLHLTVANSIWMNELTFLKGQMIENLQNAFPNLIFNDIRFKIGKVKPFRKYDKNPHAKKLKRSLTADETAFVESCVEDVPGEELKELLTDLITRNLKIRS